DRLGAERALGAYTRHVLRDELISRTRQLVDEGERLIANPSLASLQLWLKLSDDLLATAWGSMDRYHLAWLMVGKPKGVVRGRPMSTAEEQAYVREVAEQKTAALRMSLDAAERNNMPFVGETGGVGPGRSSAGNAKDTPDPRPIDRPPDRSGLPSEAGLAERLAEARRRAAEHRDHDAPRAPRPERMER
ncbi:MAG: hypothetical protein M3R57_00095, partial [Chloroflexota bacterium]|nr:hypothetical protein [Chloroflexota bacterium]